MLRRLTHGEIEELLFIEAGLRADKSTRFYGNVASSLLMKGLLAAWGMSVRITPLGEEVLQFIRNCGLPS